MSNWPPESLLPFKNQASIILSVFFRFPKTWFLPRSVLGLRGSQRDRRSLVKNQIEFPAVHIVEVWEIPWLLIFDNFHWVQKREKLLGRPRSKAGKSCLEISRKGCEAWSQFREFSVFTDTPTQTLIKTWKILIDLLYSDFERVNLKQQHAKYDILTIYNSHLKRATYVRMR